MVTHINYLELAAIELFKIGSTLHCAHAINFACCTSFNQELSFESAGCLKALRKSEHLEKSGRVMLLGYGPKVTAHGR